MRCLAVAVCVCFVSVSCGSFQSTAAGLSIVQHKASISMDIGHVFRKYTA